jgi:hypothetical protein
MDTQFLEFLAALAAANEYDRYRRLKAVKIDTYKPELHKQSRKAAELHGCPEDSHPVMILFYVENQNLGKPFVRLEFPTNEALREYLTTCNQEAGQRPKEAQKQADEFLEHLKELAERSRTAPPPERTAEPPPVTTKKYSQHLTPADIELLKDWETEPEPPPATGIVNLKVSDINTDEKRFQNRLDAFSSESVRKIVDNFDPNKLDPVTVWKDPKDGKIYMLSGHSRLEAHRQLKRQTIPAKFFSGTEEEAIKFARVDANRGATAENLVEDVRAYRLLRDGGHGVNPLPKAELKKQFRNWQKLDAYTYLDPAGQFLEIMNNPDVKPQFPYIENRAMWVGEFRKSYPALTNAHETEIFDFFFKEPEGLKITKEDFYDKMTRRLARFDFDPAAPLLLKRDINTGTDARADTASAQRRIYDLQEENKKLRERLNRAVTREEKDALKNEITANLDEISRIERDLNLILKTQTALFGLLDEDLVKYADQVVKSDYIEKRPHLVVNEIDESEARRIHRATGLDVTGYTRIIDQYGILHTLKKHGSPRERLQGQVPVTVLDFGRVPEIVAEPDSIELIHDRLVIFMYIKKINGTVYYLEEKRQGKKHLALVTMYIKKAAKL